MPKKKQKQVQPVEIDPYFVKDMAEFIGGGGPVTGLYRQFAEWLIEKGYYTREQVDEQMNAVYES